MFQHTSDFPSEEGQEADVLSLFTFRRLLLLEGHGVNMALKGQSGCILILYILKSSYQSQRNTALCLCNEVL